MDLHFILIGLGFLLLAILIGYSIWNARKEKSRVFSDQFSSRQHSPQTTQAQGDFPYSPAPSFTEELEQPYQEAQAAEQDIDKRVGEIKISLNGQSTIAEPTQTQWQAQPQTMAQADPQPLKVQLQPSEATQPTPMPEEQPAPVKVEVAQEPEQADPNPNMITLYIVAAENQQFRGNIIAQQLEAHGFLFGEHNIFHRHLDGTASSPVLYSVANMMQPGVFDLNQLHRLSTIGLVFFMYLPSEGNDVLNLNQLLQDVQSIAQHLGGFVLSDQRTLFDEDARYRYLAKVRQAR